MSIVRGRPWPAAGEELWTEADLDQALEWKRHHAELCPRCGTNPKDWRDERGRHLDPPPFEAKAVHCFGCDEVDALYESIKSDHGGEVPKSWRVVLVPYTEEAETT
ncbi:MAG: hypothetical protein AAGA99_27305 [Actinomycetota bacterium]